MPREMYPGDTCKVETSIRKVILDIQISIAIDGKLAGEKRLAFLEKAVFDFTEKYIRETFPILKW